MRARRSAIAAALSVLLCAGVVQASSAGAAPEYGSADRSYIVDTRHGKIYVEAVHPTLDGRIVESPAILTYSPYSVLGRNGDAGTWIPRGYSRLTADVVGTGNSGGCWDYGGKREKQTGYDIVEWIADQKWSTGRIGMIGGSYEGTTATAAATQRPPHLTTIVPEAAISRWYEYAYSGGIRYSLNNESLGHQGPGAITDEGFDTPAAFDFGLAIPPPVDPQDADWGDRVLSTITPCEELRHTEYGYDLETPDYDKFWLERDYIVDAKRIDIPVLVAHNWGDWNVKQEEATNLYAALTRAPQKALFMGTRWEGHGVPGGDYDKTVIAWFDHYLKGAGNGIEDLAAVTSQMSDSDGTAGWYAGRYPRTHKVELIAQHSSDEGYEWKLLRGKPRHEGPEALISSPGTNSESVAAAHPQSNATWLHFETPPLAADTRIFGSIELELYSRTERSWVTITPSVLDIAPGTRAAGLALSTDALVAVTRGFLDSRYRNSLAAPEDVRAGKPFGMTVVAKPQDYIFRKGHRIGLNIQTEILEWGVPKGDAMLRVLYEDGKTRLVLPVVGPAKDLFEP